MKNFLKYEPVRITLLLMCSLILMLIRPLFLPNIVHNPDADDYATMVKFFRGDAKIEDVGEPFRSRILLPFIASLLPGDPFFCLMVVSIIFTLLSVFLFNRFLLYFEVNEKERVLGTLIFIIAGPTIIIGSLPMTDSAGLFFTIFALYLYSSLKNNLKKDLLIGIIIGVGVLARETVILVAPIIILWNLIDKKVHWKLLIRIIIFIWLIPLMTLILIKILIPTSYMWVINFSLLISNINYLFNPLLLATIAQLSLLFIIGIFGNYSNIITKEKIIWKLIIGMGIFSILIIYSLFSASIASRFFWPLYILIIPFFILGINELGNYK